MKKLILTILIFIFPLFLCGASLEDKFIEEQTELINDFNLSDETSEILNKLGIDNVTSEEILSLSFYDFIILLAEAARSRISEPFKAVFTIFAAALICVVIHNFCDNFKQTGPVINAVSALAVSSSVLIPVKDVFISASKVIEECSDFMLGFIPLYSSVTASCGYISSAAGYRTLMLGAVTAISRLSSEIVLPLTSIYLAMSIAGSVSEVNIGEISKSFKNFSVWLLGISMTVFSCILGLGTLVSSSADSTFYKTAKFLIGGTIPVVGSAVSDALSSLRGCLTLTKNIFGIYGIIVTAAIFIPPLISVLSWKICLSAAASLCGISDNKSLSNLLCSVSSVMGILLALLVTIGIMFIFSVAILLMTGGGT